MLDSNRDISVGAYARQQRRRRVLISAVGLALIGCALWLYIALRPRDPHVTQGGFPVRIRCVSPTCNFEGVVLVPAHAYFPLQCPRCKQHSCQKVWACRNCGATFIAKGGSSELRCPQCGDLRVGTAGPATAEPAEESEPEEPPPP